MGTHNRQVKFGWNTPNRFWKIATSPQEIFFDSHCSLSSHVVNSSPVSLIILRTILTSSGVVKKYTIILSVILLEPEIEVSVNLSNILLLWSVSQGGGHTDFYACISIYSVSQKFSPWGFLTFSPKRLEIFSPNFICILHVPIYTRLQISIQSNCDEVMPY